LKRKILILENNKEQINTKTQFENSKQIRLADVDKTLSPISLTIIIPALNEEENIVDTVEGILPYAKKFFPKFEIILINDGSTDRTADLMNELAKKYKEEIFVINHEINRGISFSYREGIARASMDKITMLPSDHEIDSSTYEVFFQIANQVDVVVGNRMNQISARPKHRAFISFLYNFLMKLLFGLQFKDLHGAIIYPLKDLKALNLSSEGFLCQLEILVLMNRSNLSFVEVPIKLRTANKREKSRSLSLNTLLNVIRTTLRLKFQRTHQQRFSELEDK